MADMLTGVAEIDDDAMKGRFLTFLIDKEIFGIEIRHVMEIVGIQKITEMPEMPDYIRGIINLRGKIIPIMDVRLRFKKPGKDYTDRTCVIVIDFDGTSFGLIVDSVSEVLAMREEDIAPPPEMGQGGHKYIRGIGKAGGSVKLLLDCQKLLTDEGAETLRAPA
ncbi:Chemotaxis protein CheW [bioreactor metagenome]|uniref:Chemotaxis protein CheW n=1 Tax=bioreactor metagenome TaxID=1076179 RepID=A0A645IE31_9ZZZZ